MPDSHNPVIFHHKSIRLREFDYSSEGGYFITIVTYNRKFLFGKIIEGEMVFNEFGKIIKKEWFRTSKIRSSIKLFDDEFVVMLNHIHGIIWITDRCSGMQQRAATQYSGTQQHASTETIEQFGKPVSNSIPTIVRLFKSTSTKQINALQQTYGVPVWQRNYYEHVIRSERDYENIANYIYNNPAGWENDAEFSSSM